ncbi:MAG TPA: aminoacyl-tRNA hydrolase [Fimbriimonas sp.]|nr:aminoacyl-tRNA hydrolase [Fimbriimonas sp.]
MFRRAAKQPLIEPEWLIVGLGNPGPEYRGTRHNLGFEVIDRLAERNRIKLDKSKHRSRFGFGEIDGHGVLLVKPLTYMNLSGQAVAPMAREYRLKPDRVLVIADDTDLVPGRIRLKPQGSAGGHNGHKSLIAALGTTEYPRMKIGIGRVGRDETIDHVLSGFAPDERAVIDEALIRAAKAVETVVTEGLEAGLNEANLP